MLMIIIPLAILITFLLYLFSFCFFILAGLLIGRGKSIVKRIGGGIVFLISIFLSAGYLKLLLTFSEKLRIFGQISFLILIFVFVASLYLGITDHHKLFGKKKKKV